MFSLYNSIQQFNQFGIKNLENIVSNFYKNTNDVYSLVDGIRKAVVELGCNMIQEIFNDINMAIVESSKRKDKWHIVRTDTKQLVTSLGVIAFSKTLFKHKKTGVRTYLLDKQLGIESHERITEDAEVLLYKEAAQTSYRRAGEAVCLTEDTVSKQTVKDKVQALIFPEDRYVGTKKCVDYLYIDADEDHIALQKQDTQTHSTITKLVYLYEGIAPETPGSRRMRLVNPYYFTGLYSGKDNNTLWNEIYRYIDSRYELDKIKKIYVNADGGTWIKAGAQILGAKYVLDEFHLRKVINGIVSSVKKNSDLVKTQIYEYLNAGKKTELKNILGVIAVGTETLSEERKVLESMKYLINNWSAARTRLRKTGAVLPCSAEGHVSHVLSSRMSSRPMAWSFDGADAIARLRSYILNGRDVLKLVRYQKEKIVVGEDDIVLSCADMLANERKQYKKNGKYYDAIQASVSNQIAKKFFFRNHLALNW